MLSSSRIAIVDSKKCKPKKCNKECNRSCPVVKIGKQCIIVNSIAEISESLCNGCGICVKKCPFEAIKIINLPDKFSIPILFRYGINSFQLHRLPQLQKGTITGIIGPNGIGKTTVIKLLCNKLQPNFGVYNSEFDPKEIINHFRGSNLQHYFTMLYEGETNIKVKPQMIETLSRTQHKTKAVFEMIPNSKIREKFDLDHIQDRKLSVLSGGELQRVAIAYVYQSDATVQIYDEPTNYLDIFQRLRMSEIIQEIVIDINKYVMVVDHDLAILDYMSDYITCLYGEPGAYGISSLPYSVKEGINLYLEGYLPAENMRIRKEKITFVRTITEEEKIIECKKGDKYDFSYSSITIQLSDFNLYIKESNWNLGDIILLAGRNGTGKTTFVRYLAGMFPQYDVPKLYISYKPQHVLAKFEGTVLSLLQTKIGSSLSNSLFKSDVLDCLKIPELFDQSLQTLSGGELQRVAIALALGKSADVYLIDEPSSMLDVEMRISVATSIRRYIKHIGKSAFIVEHDIIMGTYVADKMITFTGHPGLKCTASIISDKKEGMNIFLSNMDITIRQDIQSFRPRINKKDSILDKEQRMVNCYFNTEYIDNAKM